MKTMKLSRRRFLKISAIAGLCTLPFPAAGKSLELRKWKGYALGAPAQISLYNLDKDKAEILFRQCLDEVLRLEKIFSLYEPQSVISLLNKQGHYKTPPPELIEVINLAEKTNKITDGAFDITVQPYWKAVRADTPDLKQALNSIGFKNLIYNNDIIEFKKPGMSITLNGIAQGYITDKVTELLQNAGLQNVLVELGETRALGAHPSSDPWRIGIQTANKEIFKVIDLHNQALATSGGYGTPLTEDKHHILDPRTGLSPRFYESLSVIAPTAAEADALSTGLSLLPWNRIEEITTKQKTITTIALLQNGDIKSTSY